VASPRLHQRNNQQIININIKTTLKQHLLAATLVCALDFTLTIARAADPLPSWNDGPSKQSILNFVEKVTNPGSRDFVPVSERIAVFDNDGTLWSEQPVPVQFYFVADRVKALAPQHPEWRDTEPFSSILRGDLKATLEGGDHGLMELFMATHTGMTTDEFAQTVKDWIATAKHPTTSKRFLDMTYQPMLEVLAYLRANGFKNFIVSGGGIEFMRAWTEAAYGIPPEQVVGSSMKTKFEVRDGRPVLVRLPKLNFNDDKDDKPVGINQHIGRCPIAAFGNSVGDQQMLEYTQGGSGTRFELLVMHDDARREFIYGPARGLPDVKYGSFTPALEDHAKKNGWTIASMKDDWNTIFPSEIIAIDILLQPDATMLKQAAANNARLLSEYPKGFALDTTHTPHITMLQCFVHKADLDKLYAAEEKVLAAANLSAMKLEAFKLYYIPAGGGLGVAGICAKPTPQLLKLQADIIAAANPFNLRSGPIGAFSAAHDDPAIDAAIIQYVATFEQIGAGVKFNPHVSTGTAPTTYIDQMIAEPFETFTFSPAGAAVFQLGPFGTAAKNLKEWNLQP
jgi:phosphoglycolate phosphatase-like HAD superfamily hydrolase